MSGSNTGNTTKIRKRVVGTSAAMSDSGNGSEFSKSYTTDPKELLLRACEEGRLVDVRELVAGKKVELKNCITEDLTETLHCILLQNLVTWTLFSTWCRREAVRWTLGTNIKTHLYIMLQNKENWKLSNTLLEKEEVTE